MFHPRAKAVYEKSAGIQPVMEMSQARRQRFRIHAMIICARYAYRLGMMEMTNIPMIRRSDIFRNMRSFLIWIKRAESNCGREIFETYFRGSN